MSLLELGEYMVGEPVYEVKASPRFDNSNELVHYEGDTVFHKFFQANGFDFAIRNPHIEWFTGTAPKALADALADEHRGVYYCLIKNGVIVSMQYVRDESHVRMVED